MQFQGLWSSLSLKGEEDAFLLFIDDYDEEEDEGGSPRSGCLSMVLLVVGVLAAIVALPFFA